MFRGFLIFSLLMSTLFNVGLLAAHAVDDNPLDALAIRVMPNLYHLSPLTWYKKNVDTPGSLQSVVVDGYSGVRDGRTVYISAANIDNSNLYTNIYIISYNQESESATTDIFGQFLKYWKFNINIIEEYGQGYCKPLSGALCSLDADCAKSGTNQICRGGACVSSCWLSSDCANNSYCDSRKAQIIRDVKRLADLRETSVAIDYYRGQKNLYPELTSGSYLPGKTISVWPSWSENLSKTVGFALPKDPLNRLGACENFDSVTCWSESTKTFATNFSDPVLPPGSYAFVYMWDKGTDEYRLCANFETPYANLPAMWRCDGYVDSVPVDKPQFTLGSLVSPAGPFTGYFAVDSRFPIDLTKVSIAPLDPDSWAAWRDAGWVFEGGATAGLRWSDTAVANQKKLTATKVILKDGKAFQYFKFSLTACDNHNSCAIKDGTIRVCQPRDCSAVECGKINDNCGGTLMCGDCLNGHTCINNQCQ
ncbi:hypothetical protein COT94_03150 [Candidatus Falkowbacteria bacterium CG10_big_fil_rev_8_21_14_0_10_37_14]|uniref:Uncharacterized protein n=1 Tax=Candidatus Falkowbacteria bacterium CG10_big_fil_rev_8_21_14_0_10_37_14 TaxID=1974561 RepID=A0A2M6WT45_9BACT|nr:hypothetical protein [Candidatus Falkowbacteria bacterium]PIT95958.1 MAG: hypothetical protein COT94_03150 [Candidatus Falkowbacteria bacterium CG10_big_fil_rev_8_21_14_0_10_37_14]